LTPVVTPLEHGGAPRRSRSIEERLMVAFPGWYGALTALVLGRVPPQTRLRRRFLRHALVSGWAAVQRRDFELMLVRYERDFFSWADALRAAALDPAALDLSC
jgi:hypothetical protein